MNPSFSLYPWSSTVFASCHVHAASAGDNLSCPDLFAGFPLTSAAYLSWFAFPFASFYLPIWNSALWTAAEQVERDETCPMALRRWMICSESRPRGAFPVQERIWEERKCWLRSAFESYRGIHWAKLCQHKTQAYPVRTAGKCLYSAMVQFIPLALISVPTVKRSSRAFVLWVQWCITCWHAHFIWQLCRQRTHPVHGWVWSPAVLEEIKSPWPWKGPLPLQSTAVGWPLWGQHIKAEKEQGK